MRTRVILNLSADKLIRSFEIHTDLYGIIVFNRESQSSVAPIGSSARLDICFIISMVLYSWQPQIIDSTTKANSIRNSRDSCVPPSVGRYVGQH